MSRAFLALLLCIVFVGDECDGTPTYQPASPEYERRLKAQKRMEWLAQQKARDDAESAKMLESQPLEADPNPKPVTEIIVGPAKQSNNVSLDMKGQKSITIEVYDRGQKVTTFTVQR